MTNLILAGAMALSTGVLLSTALRHPRWTRNILLALLVIEVALLATLVILNDQLSTSLWWLAPTLVVLAGAHVAFWVSATIRSMDERSERE